MVQITSIHLVGSEHHQHIQSLRWKNPSNNETGQSTRAEMVDFVAKNPTGAYATDRSGNNAAYLHAVRATPPYVQTVADNKYTNNLLSLPRY